MHVNSTGYEYAGLKIVKKTHSRVHQHPSTGKLGVDSTRKSEPIKKNVKHDSKQKNVSIMFNSTHGSSQEFDKPFRFGSHPRVAENSCLANCTARPISFTPWSIASEGRIGAKQPPEMLLKSHGNFHGRFTKYQLHFWTINSRTVKKRFLEFSLRNSYRIFGKVSISIESAWISFSLLIFYLQVRQHAQVTRSQQEAALFKLLCGVLFKMGSLNYIGHHWSTSQFTHFPSNLSGHFIAYAPLLLASQSKNMHPTHFPPLSHQPLIQNFIDLCSCHQVIRSVLRCRIPSSNSSKVNWYHTLW